MVKDERFYRLLGVEPDATREEIKVAYKRRAKELHPDKTGGDPDKEALFKQVKEAYETLSNPARRREYDEQGTHGATPMEMEARGIVSSMFASLINELLQNAISPPMQRRLTVLNSIDAMVKNTRKSIENFDNEMEKADIAKAKIDELRDLFDFDGKGVDVFALCLRGIADDLDQKIEMVKHQKRVNELVLEYLGHYKDKKPEDIMRIPFGGTSWTTSTYPTG